MSKEHENLRDRFEKETKLECWSQPHFQDIGFSDTYVHWLEKQLIYRQDAMLSLPDIRNKLSPIKNLIAIIEKGLVKGDVELNGLFLEEIEQCKESIAYLSGNYTAYTEK